MSSPIKSLFGGGGGQQSNPLLAPLMVLATQVASPMTAPASPLQTPMGGAGGVKPAMSPSFAGAAAAPTQQQIGGKTLLGQ